jgi:hypothetical protein
MISSYNTALQFEPQYYNLGHNVTIWAKILQRINISNHNITICDILGHNIMNHDVTTWQLHYYTKWDKIIQVLRPDFV